MTTASERNVAFSRGRAMAASAAASRTAALVHAGIAFVHEDDTNVIVAREYRFNLAASHWHRIDDPSVHGYLVATLLADIRDRTPNPGDGHSRREATTVSSSWTLPSSGTSETSSDLLPKVNL